MIDSLNYTNTPYLSIVIPAYNEQSRIADTLYMIKDYLAKQSYKSEIIVVDDGSQDLTTEIVKFIDIYGEEIKSQKTGILIENTDNTGKGFSVARGMSIAKGKIILFCDADMATPIEEIEKFIPFIENGFDIVIGSRNLHSSTVKKSNRVRKLLSQGLRLIVKIMALPNIEDTQCGFKAYKIEAARSIVNSQKTYGFGFDIEHLYIANKLGLKVHEVGIKWTEMPGSTIRPLRDTFLFIIDFIRILFNHFTFKKK